MLPTHSHSPIGPAPPQSSNSTPLSDGDVWGLKWTELHFILISENHFIYFLFFNMFLLILEIRGRGRES